MNNEIQIDAVVLGKNIKLYRKKNNLTQEKFAEMINCSIKHAQCMEYGTENPSLGLLVNICSALEVSPNQILTGALLLEGERIDTPGLTEDEALSEEEQKIWAEIKKLMLKLVAHNLLTMS